MWRESGRLQARRVYIIIVRPARLKTAPRRSRLFNQDKERQELPLGVRKRRSTTTEYITHTKGQLIEEYRLGKETNNFTRQPSGKVDGQERTKRRSGVFIYKSEI